MSLDLTRIIRDWGFEPGQINARVIPGDDGEPKLQVRIELGVLQMAMDGRPDGQRPMGYPSLLEYHEAQVDDESDDAKPDPLTAEQCEALRSEAVQYYHRYVALMVLEDFERVVRDTSRNLRVIDLCRDHAATEQDRQALERFRPYILMMRARAMAGLALRDNEPRAAVLAIDEGLDTMRRHFTDSGEPQGFDRASEAQVLREIREALMPKLPLSQREELTARLQQAITDENYELAAILRDELKSMRDEKPAG